MTDLNRIEKEKLAEVNITPQLLEELCKYDRLAVVRELDIFSGEWVLRIAAQTTGLTWPLPAAKD